MADEKEFTTPVEDRTFDPLLGISVYEQPTQRTVPLWAAILLLLILFALSWVAFQAFQ